MVFPLYYFGPVSWYSAMLQADEVTFALNERFTKRSWRNRCRVLGSNGPIDLSIHLQHPVDKQPTNAIRLSYADTWQKDHWHAIRSSYGRSPWFDFYGDSIEGLFQRQPEYLHEWNMEAFQTVNQLLNITVPYSTVTSGAEPVEAPHAVTDHAALAEAELQFGSARKPADSDLQPQHERYIQVFADRFGFVSNLSILDVLFNLCPEAADWLRRQK